MQMRRQRVDADIGAVADIGVDAGSADDSVAAIIGDSADTGVIRVPWATLLPTVDPKSNQNDAKGS